MGHVNHDYPAPHPTPPSTAPVPETIPVLVNFGLEPPEQAAIEAVNPRVRVLTAMVPDADQAPAPTPGWRRRDDADLAPLLAQAQILFSFRFPVEWLDTMPALRWVQLSSAGADHMIGQGLFTRRPDLIVTTASGIHAIPIGEHVIGMILAFARGFPTALRNQQAGQWVRYRTDEAHGRTVGLIGYGPIGRRIAHLAHALGMEVRVLRRSGATPHEGDDAEPVARFYGPEELPALLGASDYVVLAAPLTGETRGLIDAAALRAMRPTAVLINIGRGPLVVQPDLIAALEAGTIAGAGLDVTDPEPLPAGSPLWHLPNVLITPHLAGSNPLYNARATALFCDNLRRYLAGAPLHNQVDPARGY
jgi:phosphoglycerate dehydrogenase-like enzyme